MKKFRGNNKRSAPALTNHTIQCYKLSDGSVIYKGDTYPFRGLFRRLGCEYDYDQHGYAGIHENMENINSELRKLVKGLIVIDSDHSNSAPTKKCEIEEARENDDRTVSFIENDISSVIEI